MLGLIYIIPKSFPNTVFPVAYSVLAQSIARHYQMSKKSIAESSRYSFQSNWRVVIIGIISLFVSIIFVFVVAVAAVSSGLIKAHTSSARIESHSMVPNVQFGENVTIEPYSETSGPQVSDVVAFRKDSSTWIKRVIGLPDDKVQLIHSRVYINDKLVPRVKAKAVIIDGSAVETYVETLPGHPGYQILQSDGDNGLFSDTPLFEVPQNAYFVLGDNRDFSTDSRMNPTQDGVGFVKRSSIVGVVTPVTP